MNSPVVVWSRNCLRIVAVDADMENESPCLILERQHFDLLGEQSWQMVHLCNDSGASDALIDLMQAVVSDIEVMPKWVREFVHERQEIHDDYHGTGGKGGAA